MKLLLTDSSSSSAFPLQCFLSSSERPFTTHILVLNHYTFVSTLHQLLVHILTHLPHLQTGPVSELGHGRETAMDDGYRRLCPPTLIRRGAARRGPAREHPIGPFGNERGRRRPGKSGAGRVSPSRAAAPAHSLGAALGVALAQHWKCPQIVP